MAAVYGSQNYTVNGKIVALKWLETSLDPYSADDDEITVRNIGSKSVGDTSYFGVNGVFFNMTSPYDVICFAMQDESAVRSNGDNNRLNGYFVRLNSNLGDGTFLAYFDGYDLPAPTGTPELTFPLNHEGYTITKSNVKWAVGGLGLRIGIAGLTRTTFLNKFNNLYSCWSNRPRTAIGYKGGMKMILCTFFDPENPQNQTGGCDLWDVRTVMKDKFGCSFGLNLDGGGSTQIAYKQSGTRYYVESTNRNVQTMITVPM